MIQGGFDYDQGGYVTRCSVEANKKFIQSLQQVSRDLSTSSEAPAPSQRRTFQQRHNMSGNLAINISRAIESFSNHDTEIKTVAQALKLPYVGNWTINKIRHLFVEELPSDANIVRTTKRKTNPRKEPTKRANLSKRTKKGDANDDTIIGNQSSVGSSRQLMGLSQGSFTNNIIDLLDENDNDNNITGSSNNITRNLSQSSQNTITRVSSQSSQSTVRASKTQKTDKKKREKKSKPKSVKDIFKNLDASEEVLEQRRSVLSDKFKWKLILILDHRENDIINLGANLRDVGINWESRQLGLGDMLWIVQNVDSKEEIVLRYVIERKTADDLAASILDGRYVDQKYRLREDPSLDRIIYLVEGSLTKKSNITEDALKTSMASTQIIEGFNVVQCSTIDRSVNYIKNLHQRLAKEFNKGNGKNLFAEIIRTYEEFNAYTRNCKAITVSSIFGSQLRQINNMSARKCETFQQIYPTSMHLTKALDDLDDGSGYEKIREARQSLISNIQMDNSLQRLGPNIAKTIEMLYCLKDQY